MPVHGSRLIHINRCQTGEFNQSMCVRIKPDTDDQVKMAVYVRANGTWRIIIFTG